MILNTKLTNISIESMKNQKGDAILKKWYKPFEFYLIGTFIDNPEYKDNWNDKYKFKCSVYNKNTNSYEQVEYIGVSKYKKNIAYVMPGNSDNRVIFNMRIVTPGEYIAYIESNSNTMSIEFAVI